MDGDGESISSRLWDAIFGRFAYLVPLWIIKRPDSAIIYDYRPTAFMSLTIGGLLLFAAAGFYYFFNFDSSVASALLGLGAPAIVGLFLMFRFTIREVYYLDKNTDSYAFVRQFVHRKEVIEGSLGQFTGVYVKTESDSENNKTYFVILQQEGMLLAGAGEQILREEVPMFNSFERENRIATAIRAYLPPANAPKS